MEDWRFIDNGELIDMDSIKEIEPNIYECFYCSYNDLEKINLKHNTNVSFVKQKLYIDVKKYKYSIMGIYAYKEDGTLISGQTLDRIYEWLPYVKGSVIGLIASSIKGEILPVPPGFEPMNTFLAIILTIIVSFSIVFTIAMFFQFAPFYQQPATHTIALSVALYTLFKYKFDFKMAYPKGFMSFISRYLIILFILSVLIAIGKSS